MREKEGRRGKEKKFFSPFPEKRFSSFLLSGHDCVVLEDPCERKGKGWV